MTPIRVVLADDHAVLREGVAALVGAQADIEVVGHAATATETLEVCLAVRPNVVVLDITMPGGGIAALAELRATMPDVHVLVLTMHDDRAYLRAVIAAGGSGYLVKGAAGADLVTGIRRVAAGGSFVQLGDGAGPSLGDDVREPSVALSKREREVLVLVARGLTNRMVAERLGIKPKTVDTYRERIQEKLGLAGRAEMFAFAERAGLLVGGGDGEGA